MKQANYVLFDFLEDPDFIAWVKHPDEQRDSYWQRFLESHPQQKAVVETARQYVLVLAEQMGQQQPSAAQSETMRQTIQQRVREDELRIPFVEPTQIRWGWTRLAASVALVVGLGVTAAYWYNQQKSQSVGYEQFTQTVSTGTALVQTRNDNDTPLTIYLSDGSSVVLQPGSQLSYPDKLEQREVYLVGKAFFEVVKDPTKPFLVYTRGVATKVLGTSFFIDAPDTNKPIKVAVKTGRVAVFSLDESATTQPEPASADLSGLVLTPNQSVEYLLDSHRLVRQSDTISTFAQPGTLIVAKQSFDFDETPVPDVFRMLEKAYGVAIVYDKLLLGKCSLSASLVGQPLQEKLAVICKALDAHYALQGNRITVTGGQQCP